MWARAMHVVCVCMCVSTRQSWQARPDDSTCPSPWKPTWKTWDLARGSQAQHFWGRFPLELPRRRRPGGLAASLRAFLASQHWLLSFAWRGEGPGEGRWTPRQPRGQHVASTGLPQAVLGVMGQGH